MKIGEEYDKTTKALKEGFGATLKAIFAGWETPDRYRCWNRLFFSEFVKKQNAHVFLQEMPAGNSKTALNSTKMSTVFPQKVRKFPAKIRKYPQKYANRDFLITAAVHACDKSHQIAACWNENWYFCKLSMLQTNYFQIWLSIPACLRLWIFGGSNHQHKLCKFRKAWTLSPAVPIGTLWGTHCGKIF